MPKALREQQEKEIRIPAKHYSEVEIRASTFNEEDRTVEVCWTTGAAVKRYSWDEGYYMEELRVDKKSIRLDRFNAMPLLDSHDAWGMDQRLGTIVPGSVRIEGNKGYARIKLSRKQRAEELLQDLRDGHPLAISVGYKIHAYERTEGADNKLPVLRAIDWEPLELSAVTVPADPDAVARADPSGEQNPVQNVLIRQDNANAAQPATTNEERPMKKRDAAKKYTGEQLDALAIGAGISRNENETDDALRARLLAAYDAEDEAQRQAEEEAAKRAADLQHQIKTGQTQNTPPQIRTEPNAPAQTQQVEQAGVTAADVATASRSAVANERKRVREINELARSAGIKADDEMVTKAIDDETSVDEFRSAVFDVMIKRQSQSPTFPHVDTRGMQDQTETTRKLVANAILHRHGVVDKLEDGANEWRGMHAMDIMRELLRMRGESTRGSVHEIVQRGLHTTSDFPIILGEVTRQTLVAGYTGYENTFELISNRNVLSDFREVKMLEMGEAPELKKVNEHGEFTRGTFRESEEGLRLHSYGRILGLTRQMIINDHLGAFTQMINNWGRKVAKLEGDIVWGIIVENAKLKSGTALFHANHNNLATAGTALDLENLKKARTQFRKQKDLDGDPINIAPKYLFVGSDLEVGAQSLLTGIANPQDPAHVVPEAIRSLQPVYEYRLDKIPTKAWFLFAAKEATMGRGLQHAYLAGQEQPRYEERIGFDVDGIEYKIAHDFGAGITDYRFAYKNAGL